MMKTMSKKEESTIRISIDIFSKNLKPVFYFIYSTTWFIIILVGIFFLNFTLIYYGFNPLAQPIFDVVGWSFIFIGCGLLVLDIITLFLWSIVKYLIKSDIIAKKILTTTFGINCIIFIFASLFFIFFIWIE